MKVGKDLVAVAEFILLPAGRDLAKGRNEFEIGARLCSSLESTENLSGTHLVVNLNLVTSELASPHVFSMTNFV